MRVPFHPHGDGAVQLLNPAGIQRTTLYRRWGNTGAILLDAVGANIQSAIQIPDKGSLQKDLVAFVRASHDFHRSQAGAGLVAMLLEAPDHVKKNYWAGRYAALQQIFERAARRKEIAAQPDWNFYLDLLIAPWYFCTWAKAEPWPLDSAEHTITLVCSVLLL